MIDLIELCRGEKELERACDFLRFSPHFYNTEAELDRAVEVLRSAL